MLACSYSYEYIIFSHLCLHCGESRAADMLKQVEVCGFKYVNVNISLEINVFHRSKVLLIEFT